MGHRDSWTASEDAYLVRMFGFLPMSSLVRELGRTEDAIVRRASDNQAVQEPSKRPDVLTPLQFARAMGVCRAYASQLLEDAPFSMTMYRRNRPLQVAVLDDLKRWLANPLNWKDIDENKVAHPELRAVVEKAMTNRNLDRWLTMPQAAKRAGYSYGSMRVFVAQNRFPVSFGRKGTKGKRCNLVRQSDLDAFCRSLRQQ